MGGKRYPFGGGPFSREPLASAVSTMATPHPLGPCGPSGLPAWFKFRCFWVTKRTANGLAVGGVGGGRGRLTASAGVVVGGTLGSPHFPPAALRPGGRPFFGGLVEPPSPPCV